MVERASWNVDPLDGTGPSGLDIDDKLHNALTFVIQFVWHGTQGIIWAIQYFDKLYPVHKLVHSTSSDEPFSRSALLPLRYEMENIGAVSATSSWYVGPNSFNIEGGEERQGNRYSASNDTTPVSVTSPTTFSNLIAIRPKEFFNGIRNRASIIPIELEILTDDDIYFEVRIQALTTGGTYTSVDDDSAVEYSTDFTSITNGYVVDSGYAAGANNRSSGLARTFETNTLITQIPYTNDLEAVVIRAKRLTQNANVYASISWREIY